MYNQRLYCHLNLQDILVKYHQQVYGWHKTLEMYVCY